jgi:hypothetical protein
MFRLNKKSRQQVKIEYQKLSCKRLKFIVPVGIRGIQLLSELLFGCYWGRMSTQSLHANYVHGNWDQFS